jgi:hypothetical protein
MRTLLTAAAVAPLASAALAAGRGDVAPASVAGTVCEIRSVLGKGGENTIKSYHII